MQVGERNGASGGSLNKWEAAVGNVEDARVAFDAVAKAIDEAIYLDEDAYNQILPTMQFTKVIQVLSKHPHPERTSYWLHFPAACVALH